MAKKNNAKEKSIEETLWQSCDKLRGSVELVFIYVADTSRRGDKIALAMNSADDCIVSAIYTVFEVSNTKELLPEYLYLFFQKAEFDRYARFNSRGSAKESFD